MTIESKEATLIRFSIFMYYTLFSLFKLIIKNTAFSRRYMSPGEHRVLLKPVDSFSIPLSKSGKGPSDAQS